MQETSRSELEKKLKDFNRFYESRTSFQIVASTIDDGTVLEGRLCIHWGILHPVHLKQKDDNEPSPDENFVESDFLQEEDSAYGTLPSPKRLLNGRRRVDRSLTLPRGHRGDCDLTRYGSMMLRGDTKLRRVRQRLSILHGHIYNTETSLFVPTYGSASHVFITSHDSCSQVLKRLLDKFKVENGPENFCLCVIKSNEEIICLHDDQYPLIERILQGPDQESSKFYIMEKYRVMNISEQVEQYMNLPDAVLMGFLEKLKKDEDCEMALIMERRDNIKRRIREHIAKLEKSSA